MGLGVGDLDGDPIPDLVGHRLGSHPPPGLRHGVWFDTSESQGVRPNLGEIAGSRGESSSSISDNDGRPTSRLVFAPTAEGGPENDEGRQPANEPDDVFLQQEDGSFVAVGDEWGFADKSIGRGMVAADIDGDGWLDLIVKSFDEPAHYFRARCGSEAWLQVELVGKAPNTAGIGARVTVEAAAARGSSGSAPAAPRCRRPGRRRHTSASAISIRSIASP
jgi:hypothetical protein